MSDVQKNTPLRSRRQILKILAIGSAAGLMSVLPALHTQEGIVVGEGVNVPMRIRLDDLPADHQPKSKSAAFSSAWKHDNTELSAVSNAVMRWRQQKREGERSDIVQSERRQRLRRAADGDADNDEANR